MWHVVEAEAFEDRMVHASMYVSMLFLRLNGCRGMLVLSMGRHMAQQHNNNQTCATPEIFSGSHGLLPCMAA